MPRGSASAGALRGSIAARRHRAEEPQRVDFVAALLVCSGEGDGGPERCLGPVRGSIAFQAEAFSVGSGRERLVHSPMMKRARASGVSFGTSTIS